MRRKSLQAIGAAVSLTVPWAVVWLMTSLLPRLGYGVPGAFRISTGATVLITGLSVLGAAFLLAWAAETAEKDVPRAFAIAVLAVLAVAPEYAVDALYAWGAGTGGATTDACAALSPDLIERVAELPSEQINTAKERLARGCHSSNLAVANMTGANRILIGIGWAGIALFTIFRTASSEDPSVEKRAGFLADVVTIDRDIALEIFFLLLATVWAFLIPMNGGIDAFDMIFLVGLYVAYIAIILRGDVDPQEEHVGVPAYLQSFPKVSRIAAVVLLFVYSGLMIFVAVEPFAHGLEEIGTSIGVPSFFMIQWIAPLASESPELIVVLYLVNKARSTAGFNALISSKLNQWTLLIGTLVVVYSLGLGGYGALPFDQKQTAEIWLTAAQSFFAIAVLINFEISGREAVVLLTLFLSQVVFEFLIIRDAFPLAVSSHELLLAYSGVYMVIGMALFALRRGEVLRFFRGVRGMVSAAF